MPVEIRITDDDLARWVGELYLRLKSAEQAAAEIEARYEALVAERKAEDAEVHP